LGDGLNDGGKASAEAICGRALTQRHEGAISLKILIASDHAAFEAKAALLSQLSMVRPQMKLLDLGPYSSARCDYPDFAAKLGHAVVAGEAELGILLCGTGIGMSIAANKISGVRAALAHDELSARLARQHNDANILCLGGRLLGELPLFAAVEAFLNARFEGGRHQGRLEKISALEP